MDHLTARELEIITVIADIAINRTLKVLGIKTDTYCEWVTKNQAYTIYGISPKRLNRLILDKSVREKTRSVPIHVHRGS